MRIAAFALSLLLIASGCSSDASERSHAVVDPQDIVRVACDHAAVARAAREGGPVRVNTPGPNYITPLTMAVICQDLHAARQLIAGGADPDLGTGTGLSRVPILLAARTGQVEMVRLLVESGADIDTISVNRRYSTLSAALVLGAFDGDWTMFDFVLQQGFDTNLELTPDRTIATSVVAVGQHCRVRSILEHGYNHDLGFLLSAVEASNVPAESEAGRCREELLAELPALIENAREASPSRDLDPQP